jgi:hypothetical protein
MKLETHHFGTVSYEQHEVIRIQGIGHDRTTEFSWLLLADQTHPHLYWLQSVADLAHAMPVCSLVGVNRPTCLRLIRSQVEPEWSTPLSLIALAEIHDQTTTISLDLTRPILIDPRTRRGIRLAASVEQAVQREPSEKVAPLRECA